MSGKRSGALQQETGDNVTPFTDIPAKLLEVEVQNFCNFRLLNFSYALETSLL